MKYLSLLCKMSCVLILTSLLLASCSGDQKKSDPAPAVPPAVPPAARPQKDSPASETAETETSPATTGNESPSTVQTRKNNKVSKPAKPIRPPEYQWTVESEANSEYHLSVRQRSGTTANYYELVIDALVPDGKKAFLEVAAEGKSPGPIAVTSNQPQIVVLAKEGKRMDLALRDETNTARANASLVVPIDGVIAQDFTIEAPRKKFEITGVNRLFARDVTLFTMGHPVRLVANQLEMEKTFTIETFPQGAKAEKGKSGRSGGVIEILAKRAVGKLKILSRGESGGEGANGGDTARVLVIVEEKGNFDVEIIEEAGQGGAKGKPLPYCFRIGSEVRGDCESFK